MKIHITFQDGPITAEIEVSEDEDYKSILNELSDFVEEYDPLGDTPNENYNSDESSTGTSEIGSSGKSKGKPNSYFDEVDATDTEIQRNLKVGKVEDNEVKEFPQIIGDTSILADSKHERLLNGAVIILTTLNDIHGISTVKTSDLKDALEDSGLSKESWSNLYKIENEGVYLNRQGSGNSATTEIRGPGKNDAYEYIQLMVEDLRKENEEKDD